MKSNRAEVMKLLVWYQGLPKEISPCYITLYNFDDFKNTCTLVLYANKLDVQYKGDGLVFDGLWRLITQKPSTITAHRIYDLVDKLEEVDPELKWTLRGLKKYLFRDEFTLIEEKYMRFKVDYPELDSKKSEADKIHEEDEYEIAKLRAIALGETLEEPSEPKESAKDKASKLWKVDEED